MKLHLIMHENRDELAHFAYHRSSHPKAVIITENPNVSKSRLIEIATSSIPKDYQDNLQTMGIFRHCKRRFSSSTSIYN